MAAQAVKIPPATLSQGFINAYYVKVIANNDLEPEQIYEKLAALYGSKNPILLIRQSTELRTKEEIVAKFSQIKSRGPILVECQGFNGDYLSLSGHPAGEPAPFHLVTWGTMKIGSEPAVPFTESFVLSGSRTTGSSYSYSINRSVLLFPTLTTDIDENHNEAPVSSDSAASGQVHGSPMSDDWLIVPTAVPSLDSSSAPPPNNRSREPTSKARTPKKVQDSSDSPTAAAVSTAAAESSVKEKQEKQPAPTSYASAARMAPSAPKDDARPPRGASGAAAGAASVVAAAAAPVQHRETVDDIPNGVIVKKIPEGVRLTKDLAEALLPGKKIASVQAVADKSHGFIYLASEDDLRQLSFPSGVTVSHGGSTITVTIDRKKPKTPSSARSGEAPRGRPQQHPDGFTQVAPRSRGGRSEAHDGDNDGLRRLQGGRGMSGGRGGKA